MNKRIRKLDNAESVLESEQVAQVLPDIKENPLDEISTTSALLGVLFGGSAVLLLLNYHNLSNLYLYIIALSVFHFLEFYTTAKYNPKKVHSGSFIINNGSGYLTAHSIAIFEILAESYFVPEYKGRYPYIKIIGGVILVLGQLIRSAAMIHAGQSFSHLIATKREKEHVLVTDGIYRYLRHPSYMGFFWWAIGTQLLLLNPVSLAGFVVVLWLFFHHRIVYEEKLLIQFFGNEYVQYRNRTPVLIPFIK